VFLALTVSGLNLCSIDLWAVPAVPYFLPDVFRLTYVYLDELYFVWFNYC
jgi:hypothetical protein